MVEAEAAHREAGRGLAAVPEEEEYREREVLEEEKVSGAAAVCRAAVPALVVRAEVEPAQVELEELGLVGRFLWEFLEAEAAAPGLARAADMAPRAAALRGAAGDPAEAVEARVAAVEEQAVVAGLAAGAQVEGRELVLVQAGLEAAARAVQAALEPLAGAD